MTGRVGRLAVALFFTLAGLGFVAPPSALAQPESTPPEAPTQGSRVRSAAQPGVDDAAPAAPSAEVEAAPVDGEGEHSPAAATSGITGPALPSSGLERRLRTWLASRDVACDYRGVWSDASQVLVACGSDGYLVLGRSEKDFVFHEARQLEGDVVGFFQHSGKVWARVLEERAVVVRPASATGSASSQSPPRRPSAPIPESAEPASVVTGDTAASSEAGVSVTEEVWPEGEVLAVEGLQVKVSMGAQDGVETRMRVAFSDSNAVVGIVSKVMSDHSWVDVGMNETVKVGETALVTAASVTASRSAPDRVTGVWELRAILRPMLNLGSFGGGLLGEVSAASRSKHFHYGVQTAPFGIAGSDNAGVATASAFIFGAFDSKVFSAGIGLGGQTVNKPEFGTDKGSGMSLVQLLRIGAVDGLHLMSRTRAVVFRSRTEFSSLELQGQLSVARDSWLILRGGGGIEGYGYGEVAVRNLLRGNGGAGSVFLELSVGGASIFQDYVESDSPIVPAGSQPRVNEEVAGPIAGIGAEWRL